MVRVKICGITSRQDAFAALDAGADALGFNMIATSPRRISPPAARAIIRALPPLVTPVGVFAGAGPGAIRTQAAFCGFALAQVHGDEPPGLVGRIARSLDVLKVIRVRDARDIAAAAQFRRARLLLFDAYAPGRLGGTGATFQWTLLRRHRPRTPFLLAGGLTPANVAEAVRTVRPFGVDVASGVESSPRKKDVRKVRAFIRAAKHV